MFWVFVIGIAVGIGIHYLVSRPAVQLAWYDYVLMALGLVFAYLAIQNFIASLNELESTAAWILLAAFGVPALVFMGIEAARITRNRTPSAG